MGKRELVALLNLSSWCLVIVEGLFLAVPRGCLRFVIVVFPDHTHLLFCRHERADIISGKQIKYAIPMLVILAENAFHIVGFKLFNSIFRVGSGFA